MTECHECRDEIEEGQDIIVSNEEEFIFCSTICASNWLFDQARKDGSIYSTTHGGDQE